MTVDSLIDKNHLITGLNNIDFRKVNAKPYGSDKTYMVKDIIENKLYQIIGQFIERKVTTAKFY